MEENNEITLSITEKIVVYSVGGLLGMLLMTIFFYDVRPVISSMVYSLHPISQFIFIVLVMTLYVILTRIGKN